MRGFSLIELIVAITIITVMSGSAFIGFSRYAESEKNRAKQAQISSTIRNLDNDIALQKTAAYRLYAYSWASWIIVEKNFFRKANSLKIHSFDPATGSWKFSGTNGTLSSWSGANITSFRKNKIVNATPPVDGFFPFTFNEKFDTFIFSTNDGEGNSFTFIPFDEEDENPIKQSHLLLSGSDNLVIFERIQNNRQILSVSPSSTLATNAYDLRLETPNETLPITLSNHD